MSLFIRLWLLTVPVFLALDAVWLGLAARGFYKQHLGPLMRPEPAWGAAAVFYLLYIAGIVLFVVRPALLQGSTSHALLYGAAFGLIAYATYDLTNLATLNGFPTIVAGVDLIWGAVLTGTTAWVVTGLALRFGWAPIVS